MFFSCSRFNTPNFPPFVVLKEKTRCWRNKCYNHWAVKRSVGVASDDFLGYGTADTFVITIFHHLNIPTRSPDFNQTLSVRFERSMERYNSQTRPVLELFNLFFFLLQTPAKKQIIYFSRCDFFCCLLELCLISKEANNNWNNIFYILYSILDVRPIKSFFSGWGELEGDFELFLCCENNWILPEGRLYWWIQDVAPVMVVIRFTIPENSFNGFQLRQSHKISSVLQNETRKILFGNGKFQL